MALTKEEFDNLRPGDRIKYSGYEICHGTVIGWDYSTGQLAIKIDWDNDHPSKETLDTMDRMELCSSNVSTTTKKDHKGMIYNPIDGHHRWL